MGNTASNVTEESKASKASVDYISANVITPTQRYVRKMARYILHFDIDIQHMNTNIPLLKSKAHVQSAIEDIQNPNSWAPFLETLMTDAVQEELIKELKKKHVYFAADLSCTDIKIHLEERHLHNQAARYKGYISWKSALCSSAKILERAIQWHIGNRMSRYGIYNDSEKWCATINPGTLHVSTRNGIYIIRGCS
jgi:hypothetical protein